MIPIRNRALLCTWSVYSLHLRSEAMQHLGQRVILSKRLLTPDTLWTLSSSLRVQHFCIKKPFIGLKSLEKFHKSDGMPGSYSLVYRNSFPNYFISAQAFVLLAIGAFVCTGIAALLEHDKKKNPKKEGFESGSGTVIIADKTEILEKNSKPLQLSEVDNPGAESPIPQASVSDLIDKDLDTFGVFLASLVILSVSLFRLVRVMPVRLYIGKKGHCVAILYGSYMPGRALRQEFVAGTLRLGEKKGILSDVMYKDGSGYTYLLMEHCFRYPGDLNYLQGFQAGGEKDYDATRMSEMDQMKQSGSLARDAEQRKKP